MCTTGCPVGDTELTLSRIFMCCLGWIPCHVCSEVHNQLYEWLFWASLSRLFPLWSKPAGNPLLSLVRKPLTFCGGTHTLETSLAGTTEEEHFPLLVFWVLVGPSPYLPGDLFVCFFSLAGVPFLEPCFDSFFQISSISTWRHTGGDQRPLFSWYFEF